uniref:TRIP4/RQT4 C2HC5-type zinc finger domain-containing protein n=1 Tax=Spongospora subterranea TaxID=70186 RepID=A0A0H5R5E7_9EUKA|eukprot:CRZ09358.1 hypothetical protein [Spongospora subterranea]
MAGKYASNNTYQWIRSQLKEALQFDDVNGIADHLMYGVENRDELIGYGNEVIGTNNNLVIQIADRLYPIRDRKTNNSHVRTVDPNRGRGLKIKTIPSNRSRHTRPDTNRKQCSCFGTEHAVFSNCLSCGRISCAVEKAGPCFFCGTLVGNSDDVSNRSANQLSSKADTLYRATQVIDDQEPVIAADKPLKQSPSPSLKLFPDSSLSGPALQLYRSLCANLENNTQ